MRGRLAACAATVALLVPLAGTASADVPLAYGTITARFTGQPVPGACVVLYDENETEAARACANEVGEYQVSGAASGYYKIKVSAPGYVDTWNAGLDGDARDSAGAKAMYLYGGSLDLGLRPPGEGALSGRVTAAHPVRGQVTVSAYDIDYPQQRIAPVTVAADGTYRIAGLWSAHYQLKIKTWYDGEQWYHQKEAQREADVVTVPAGPDTVVNEQIIPPGTVELTVADEVTGAPVKEFCVFTPGIGAERPCTTNGLINYQLVRGTYTLAIATQKTHFSFDQPGVTVRPREVTKVVAKAKPAIAIQTKVTDAKSGSPVAGTCVEPVDVTSHGIPGVRNTDWCSDESGVVTIGPLDPAVYRLFVRPGGTMYGMQWVGRLSGGTGDQEHARKVDGKPGVYTRVPPIRLDLAGTISGTVKDKQTGNPVSGVKVFPYAATSAYDSGGAQTDGQGAYTVTGLGPYWWPLEFTSLSGTHAWQWSGGAADRFGAVKVKVNSGGDTKADETLSAGGGFSGTTSVEGTEYGWVEVTPVNARTGDVAGEGDTDHSFGYTINGLAAQEVKVHFREVSSTKYRQVWYKDAASFGSAAPVRITAGELTSGIDQHLK
ncbi:carboxypeptidase regulatory-like domain-containing protein [Kibdelosporangium persicum]|uniref:Alpha-amylase n=1 Tax=Kibdelosporangium persicum TaxID=2698649 RepID=A0ABX2F981_9PSEU|nr:carboxypeptidase regulatory-like domain-containing protein [Kibdelosporangium persicum]NRN67758.1 hypothetical protein [Kibdelosporangium persicum]